VAADNRTSLRDDVRDVAWWVLVGAASGAISGFLIGGVGGRLAMLVLRLTSPSLVSGLTSDDGFEMGIVSFKTVNLLLGMAALGTINGVLYAALRSSIPRSLRLPLWSLVAAALGGATIVHEDGVDFSLLEPVALAVVLFILLPGLAAAVVVVLVERFVGRGFDASRRLARVMVGAAFLGTLGLLFATLVGVAALVVRRAAPRVRELLGRVGRIVVPAGLALVTVDRGVELIAEASRLI
jgi:hypothetical protein